MWFLATQETAKDRLLVPICPLVSPQNGACFDFPDSLTLGILGNWTAVVACMMGAAPTVQSKDRVLLGVCCRTLL